MFFNINPIIQSKINFKSNIAFKASNAVQNNQLLSQLRQDIFVKSTSSDLEFENIYKNYFTLDKLKGSITPEIKSICLDTGLNFNITQEKINSFDKNHLKDTYNNALLIAKKMNLSQKELNDLKLASALHDIGKLFIPDEILNKKGKLTKQEREIINKHSELGYRLALSLGLNENIANAILNHHSDKKSSNICEIIKVADRYSALTSRRSYKKQFSPLLSLAILNNEANNHKISKEVLNALA